MKRVKQTQKGVGGEINSGGDSKHPSVPLTPPGPGELRTTRPEPHFPLPLAVTSNYLLILFPKVWAQPSQVTANVSHAEGLPRTQCPGSSQGCTCRGHCLHLQQPLGHSFNSHGPHGSPRAMLPRAPRWHQLREASEGYTSQSSIVISWDYPVSG